MQRLATGRSGSQFPGRAGFSTTAFLEKACGIVGRDRHIFFILCTWETEDTLIIVRDMIGELLISNKAPPTLVSAFVPRSVPLSDSNKHSERASGANGMKEGDRVIHELDKRHGVAGEFLQDGDCFVFFDDGKHDTVKWVNLITESGW